jgi:hypothetical protein
MTLWSTFCRRLIEAKRAREHGGVPNAPAKVVPNTSSSGFTWFFDAAAVLNAKRKEAKKSKSTIGNFSASKVYERHLESTKREADSASSFSQVTRESSSIPVTIKLNTSKLREASRESLGTEDDGHNKFDVVMLVEGLGNFGDAHYYHRTALESAIPLLTGAKIYADHPSALEEETRPERSTRDVLGHYEDLDVDGGDESQAAKLCAVVDIMSSEQWALARMQRAIENAKKFPDKNFVGLSINATGDAEDTPIEEVLSWAPEDAKPKLLEAQQNGIDSVKVVRKLTSAVSCDFVTEAGAGGKINNSIEGE